MKRLGRNTWIGLTVAGFSLIVLFLLIPTQIEMEAEYDLASLSPAFFPRLAAGVILGLSLLLLLYQLRTARQGAGPPEGEKLSRGDELRVLIAMVVSILYFLVVDLLGFLITNTVALAALFSLQGRPRFLKLAGLSMGTTAGVYLFFHYLMKVHFPAGSLFK